MSENETPTPGQGPDESALSNLASAVNSTIPKPEVPVTFGYGDEHTAENTPMKELVAPADPSKKQLEDKDRERGFSTIYMGNSKADNVAAQELIGRWLALTSIQDLRKKGRASESMMATATNDWHQFLEKTYPGKTSAEMQEKALSMYRFFDSLQDDMLLRTKLILEPDITNLSRRSSKLAIADILGRVPGADTKGFSISEEMTRASLRSTGSAYQYTTLLRNSFLQFSFTRAAKMESADLINNINATVRGYVRQVGGNSMAISTIAGMKAVWEWLYPRVVSSSVDGIVDFKDLSNIIRVTDFYPICNAILASLTDDGIGMDLRCINTSCDHGSFDLMDPTKFTQIRPGIQTDAEAAIFGNIANGRKVYNRDEVLALIDQSTYGLEDNRVYNESRGICLTIAPPSLAEAFATFDFFVGDIDPQLASIRAKVVDENQLQEQIAITLNSLGGAEFIQWVDAFTIMPAEGSEEKPKVIRRQDANPDEFNRGLLNVLKRDHYLNSELTRFVYNKAPYMTRTFTGLRNHECPKCKHNSAEGQGERQLGYTPIDSFMTFFTHTQLMLMDEAVRKQNVVKEALS